jgi:hypothetical protein
MRALLGLGAWNVLADKHFLLTVFHQGGLLWSWVVYWVIFGVQQTFRFYEHYLASELRLEVTRVGSRLYVKIRWDGIRGSAPYKEAPWVPRWDCLTHGDLPTAMSMFSDNR